jgi:lipopolysaccharide biosynthesis regulator YciM
MVRGEKSKSISLLKDVVKNDTSHIQAYLQLGNILRDESPEQSLKIHQSLTVRPNLQSDIIVDIHKALALDYERLGDQDKTKSEIEKILNIEKRNLWALSSLIKISENEKNWDHAASLLKRLQKITGKKNDDNFAKFEVYKGLDNLDKGQFDEAKIYFQRAIKISPEYSLSYKYLGNIYEQTRDLVNALENWEIYAIKELKHSHTVFPKIESALFDLGRYSEVEKFYKRVLEKEKSNYHAIIRLSNVLEEKGERVDAISLLDNFLIENKSDILTDLMKLKLLVPTSTPIELTQKLDSIIERLLIKNVD